MDTTVKEGTKLRKRAIMRSLECFSTHSGLCRLLFAAAGATQRTHLTPSEP